MAGDEHEDGYAGPATLTVEGRDIAVHALLDARHEPTDGKLHWFGRLTIDDGQQADALARATTVELRTLTRRSTASIGDVDPWGRYRVTGVGLPPYEIDAPPLDD